MAKSRKSTRTGLGGSNRELLTWALHGLEQEITTTRQRLQELGRVPVWSTGESNLASRRVAEKIGLQLVRRRTYLSLPHEG